MKTRRILSFVLTLTMLLTLFSGEFASAAGMKIVTAGEELAYDPLAETASVAYEQHDAGYAVSLDRAADSVTMRVTAVPGSRGADKARLYVRTGVELKAGTAYRVSFMLSSEKKLADYAVNFDGDTAAAYGKLDKRSIDAGATDRVEYTVTPKAASGELVLRLLLGKTEVNTLRFSDLAVEEAPAEQSGTNKLLVDKLNYAAPGAIRCAAEAGYSAEMESTDTSATMTVTNVPKSGAEVWKLKLMVSTGLKPEPGKTYRFRATLNASDSGSYEACYNEGEVEKGYDVLYNQSLKSGSQTVERMIYVPTDKENPGELIVQFSLGKLSKGTKVTISKVTVEEASPAYTNALAKDFALDTTEDFERKIFENKEVGTTDVTPAAFNWSSAATVTMERGEALHKYSDKAEIVVKGINVWDGLLTVHTGTELADDTIYRVSLNVKANADYDNYEILYGNGYDSNNIDNNHKYGALKKRALRGGAGYDTVEYLFNTGSNGGVLQITLQVGATGNVEKTVTVSGLKVERMDDGDYAAKALSTLDIAGNAWETINTPAAGIYTETAHYAQLKVTTTGDYNDQAAIALQPCHNNSHPENAIV